MPKIEPTSGGDQLVALMRLLQDPQGMASRLKELQDAERDAMAAIAAVGSLEQVRLLREQAERDAQRAGEMIRKAREEALVILEDATATRAAAVEEAKATRAELVKARKALKDHQVEWEQRVAAKQDELKTREQAVQASEITTRTAEHAALALKAEWEAKVTKLTAAMGG